MARPGAYVLYLDVAESLTLNVGVLKNSPFPAGRYAYVGSASGGIDQRIARHRRLAEQKTGKRHWHIDYLLAHPQVRITGEEAFPDTRECEVSRQIASRRGTTVPVLNFGSTDCKAGCPAHLYRIHSRTVLQHRPATSIRGTSRTALEARPHRQH